jgi:hypothetical protein
MARATALRLLALLLCFSVANAAIAYDIEKPWLLWTSHARHAMLTGKRRRATQSLPHPR